MGKAIAIVAGLCTIGGTAVAVVRADDLQPVRDWLTDGSVAGWAFALLAAGALVAVFLVTGLLRRRPNDGSEEVTRLKTEVETTVTELSVATSYLSTIDDFMASIRQALSKAAHPDDALAELEPTRRLVFDSVIQGINSTRGEHIRCVFFKLAQEQGGLVLRPSAHHGHTADVEKLWLWADARSAAGRAFITGETVYISENARGDARVQDVPEAKPMESLLCIPAFGPGQDQAIGVFSVDSTRKDAFSLADREFSSACASILALVDFLADVFQRAKTDAETPRKRSLASGSGSQEGG